MSTTVTQTLLINNHQDNADYLGMLLSPSTDKLWRCRLAHFFSHTHKPANQPPIPGTNAINATRLLPHTGQRFLPLNIAHLAVALSLVDPDPQGLLKSLRRPHTLGHSFYGRSAGGACLEPYPSLDGRHACPLLGCISRRCCHSCSSWSWRVRAAGFIEGRTPCQQLNLLRATE